MRADFRRLVAACVIVLLVTSGCTPAAEVEPVPTPSVSPTQREFTVASTGPIQTVDPAAALGDSDRLLAASLYQRLMTVNSTTGELKPDAASDCLFSAPKVYQCTLPEEDLVFHNGDSLTSSDVLFSLQRALRLNVAGSGVALFGALKRITTPDERTIRFHLSYSDNQFGYALASLAASIVDEETFDPDEVLGLETLPIGSGPYSAESIDGDGADLVLNEQYQGALAGGLERIRFSRLNDSVAAEAAVAEGTVDVVWRSLDGPALARIESEIAASTDKTTAAGFTRWQEVPVQTNRLRWRTDSSLRSNNTLRKGVALALQNDRTLASLVPSSVAGGAETFAIGGRAELPTIKGKRINLTLRYDPTAPGHADLASLLRDRIENLDKVSVRLVTHGSADLELTDDQAWVQTAVGWLQSYLENPLAGSADKLQDLQQRARTTSDDARVVALEEIQQQAAVDLTVLPVSTSPGIVLVGAGVSLIGSDPFSAGGQLGLWSIRND